MPDKLTPMSGTTADKVLAKQTYAMDTVAQNMFAEPVQKGRRQLVPPTTLKGVTVQQLWDHVFADNTDFLKRYHDKRNETNLDVGTWHYAPDKGSGYRFVSLTTIVEVPRAGTKTQLNEAHRFAYVNVEGGKQLLVYQISSQTPNVMSGSSFRVDSYCEITADSPDASCSIAFWGQCKKMGSFMLVPLSVIEPRAMKEMTAGYKTMVDMMQKELAGGAAGEEAAADANATTAAAAPPAAAATTATTTTTTTTAPVEAPRATEMVVATPAMVAESPTSGLFQGVLMALALLVALFVIWSSVTVRRTAVDAARIRAAMRGLDGCGGGGGCYAHHHTLHGGRGACDGGGGVSGVRSSIASTLDADGATAPSSSSSSSAAAAAAAAAAMAALEADVMSEEQALYKAAQDAQINTLRYRWLEQRDAITALEGNVWWMQCAIVLLLVVSFALSMRVFFC